MFFVTLKICFVFKSLFVTSCVHNYKFVLKGLNLLPIIQPAPELNGTYDKPVSFNCTIPSNWVSTKFMIKGEHGYKFSVFSGHPCEVPLHRRSNYTISCHGKTLTIGILQPEDNTTWQCTYHDRNSDKEYTGSTTLNLQPGLPSMSMTLLNEFRQVDMKIK